MTTGDLRERVRFEARATTGDEYGNPTAGGFVAQFTRSAAFKPLIGGEEVMQARLGGTQPVVISVRYDSSTTRITPEWRCVDTRTGAVYEIRTAVDMKRRKQYIEMMAVALGETV